jgi:uncharacterized short protein YbdD (DUF466 family)
MASHAAQSQHRRGSAVLRRVWRRIREWCGDAAYERYLESRARHFCGAAVLTREEFYLAQLQQKYSRVSRCC